MNFIITGCASAGKTTLVEALAGLGYTCFDEISRKIIREQLQQKTSAVPWLDTQQFCHLVFREMAKRPVDQVAETCFFDRELPDVIAYLKARNRPVPNAYYDLLSKRHYASVAFLLEPNASIYIQDNERRESFEEASFFFQAVQKTYQQLGFRLQIIPFMPVALRAEYVLDCIDNMQEFKL